MRITSVYGTIIIATASILWLDSCCKHHNVVQEDAIDMGVSETGTKAIVNDKASLIQQAVSTGTGFGVFGYKTIRKEQGGNPDLYQIFDNVQVSPASNTENPDWTYSPKRYWDKNPLASYQYIAYWPHLGTTSVNGAAYATQQNKILTIHDIPFWQDASLDASADYMTAVRTGNYSQGDFTDPNTNVTKVNFTFSHILAKFVIKAYYIGVKQTTVTIKGLRLNKGAVASNRILSSTGKASYSQPFGTEGNTGFTGNTPDSETYHILYAPAQTGLTLPETAFDDEVEPDGDYTSQEICAWLMVPTSGWQDLGLSVDYSIGGGSTATTNVNGLTLSTTINNALQAGVTDSGKSYIVTLKFDTSGGGVELQSVLVRNWVNQEISTSVYNW